MISDIYTGIDIVENKRIEEAIQKFGNSFLNRVFTEKELLYCKSKKEIIPCLSARFAAKEACIKAFSSAFGVNLSLKQIEILGFTGKNAEILLHHDIEKINIPINAYNLRVSISHEKNYSVASVILFF